MVHTHTPCSTFYYFLYEHLIKNLPALFKTFAAPLVAAKTEFENDCYRMLKSSE